jgi:tripartite-type tricarboxylate transporter receptor subunit TctC
VSQKLSESLGQSVVVDNRPGATGIIGTDVGAKSPPDGYTLLMVTAGTHAINASLFKDLPYDPVKDFVHINFTATAPNVLIVNNSVPANDVRRSARSCCLLPLTLRSLLRALQGASTFFPS